jgi:hypothetical protein
MTRPRFCTECWAAGNRDILAIARTPDGDDLCLFHIRESGIHPDMTTPIAQPESAAPIVAAREKRIAESTEPSAESETPTGMSPRGIPTTPGTLCKTCNERRLRKDSVGGECMKCRKAASKKAPGRPAKSRPPIGSDDYVPELSRTKKLSKKKSPIPQQPPAPPAVALPSAVSINVTEAWLDGFWRLLSFEQKANLVSSSPVMVTTA